MEDPTGLFWGARVGDVASPLPIPTIESRLKERLGDSAKIWVAVPNVAGRPAEVWQRIYSADGKALVVGVPSVPSAGVWQSCYGDGSNVTTHEGDPAMWAHQWAAYRESYARDPRPARLPRPTCPEVTRVDILSKDLAFKMQEFLRRVIDLPLAAAGDMLNLPTEAITKILLSEPRPVYVPKPPPKVAKAGPGIFAWDSIRKSVRKQLAIETITRWKNKELNVGLTFYEEREMDAFVLRLDDPDQAAEKEHVGQPRPGWWLDFEDFWDESLGGDYRASLPPRGDAWRGMLGAIAVKYYSEQAQKRAAKMKKEQD